jgi:hypothetical protein
LIFNSHEVVQEKRTSLDLSPDDSLCFKKNFELQFDINFLPRHAIYFGYVVRIIAFGNNAGSYQNIDLIYNQRTSRFQLIIGESFSGISFAVDSPRLYKEWNRFAIKCDPGQHTLQFSLNGRPIGSASISGIGSCFKFLWGANDFQKFSTRDIPPMQIKDIRILENGVPKYDWPLDETSGDKVFDKISRKTAQIKNPDWIKPKYQKWELTSSFTINGYAGAAYDARQDRLFIAGSDSMAVFTFDNGLNTASWISSRHEDLLVGHQAIYDTVSGKLYDVFIDNKIVASYEFNNSKWDQAFAPGPLTEYWHANKFISGIDSSLYIIGGYGQLRYKNAVQRYQFRTKKWDTIQTSGDHLPPRYLSALGADPEGKYAYIIGGYGSPTGDQMLDPRNYYDLFRFDVKKRSFKKIFSLKPLAYPFTFANSLVIPAKPDTWYGLLFANDSYNSSLQLIQGSLNDSSFRLVANSIPYSFHDVQSFADLYYSPLSNKLIAVTLFYSRPEDRQKNTQVRIYTLNFPPAPAAQPMAIAKAAPGNWNIWLFCGLGLGALGVFYLVDKKVRSRRARLRDNRFRKNARESSSVMGNQALTSPAPPPASSAPFSAPLSPDSSPVPSFGTSPTPASGSPVPSAIHIFGPFEVSDKEGHDITRLFTPLLKELFLVITIYTIRNGKGISSEGLNEILWHDKAEKDAKNNRSVNLVKLKIILEKIGNCVISKESGCWQLQILDPHIVVDYRKFVSLVQGTPDMDTGFIHQLLDIIKRGPFLFQTDYNWLDDIKSEISNIIIDRCLGYIRSRGAGENPEFIIEITNCIFYFDHLNEDALTIKCKNLILLKRHTLASNTYQKFVKDYKDIYGADFGKSFQEIIS